MPSPDRPASGAEPDESNMSRSYLAVMLVWVAVLAGLYWLGRHFG